MTFQLKSAFLLAASILLASCQDSTPSNGSNEEQPGTPPAADTTAVGDNSQNSLDWAGVYEGTLPCTDCDGIHTVLTLNGDNTYTKVETRLGKQPQDKTEESGTFSWQNGSVITLAGGKEPSKYSVGENLLTVLDKSGNAVTGQKADSYVLSKASRGDNSQNSLDWPGIYEGTLACSDCDGVATVLTLNSDNTYKKVQTYLRNRKKEKTEESGTCSWENGSIITLSAGKEHSRFQVGENRLFELDKSGNVVTGPLADKYVLSKKK